MPTIKPRITVTLPAHVGETYRRLAMLQKRSAGAVCAELLEASHEPIMRVVAILEAASEAPVKVREGVKRAAEQAEFEAIGHYGKAIHQLDWLLHEVRESNPLPAPITKPGGKPKGRKAGAARRAAAPPRPGANPRPSNTGVRSLKRNTGGKK